jgi:mono/diheme cytochrome c family protein
VTRTSPAKEIAFMRLFVSLSALLLIVCATGAQDKPVATKSPTQPAAVLPGKRLYLQYCAACHGANARGDGPAASVLKTPPSDLTTLSKRHDGKFPHDYVSNVLRFGIGITAHGSSDMPTWGPIFGSLENYNDVAVRKHIKDLCDYLAALQETES